MVLFFYSISIKKLPILQTKIGICPLIDKFIIEKMRGQGLGVNLSDIKSH